MSAISKTPKPVNINEDPALAYLNQHTTYTVVPPIENATSAIQSEPITQLVTNVFQVNPPLGTNGSIQFNANGTYIGDTGLQFDPITDTFTTGSVIANSITINGNANTLKLLGGVNRNVLTTDGNGNLSWSDVLPARSGNTGKFLVTNGVSTEWSSMPYSNFATTTDVANAINNLVGTAPGILDTLGEIANVIGQTNNPEYGIISQLANKANITSLAQVAFSGSYLDLSYKPTISTAGTTGNYEDLHHLPSIPTRLMDLGISDGANGAILTTNGNGAFSFTAPSTVTDRLVNSGRAVTLSSTGQLTLPSATNENSTDNARIHSVKNIDILADMSLWTFSTTGNITFPDNTRQTSAWTGNVAYADITSAPSIPAGLLDLGISDGTIGQVLTANGNGTYHFTSVTGSGATDNISSGSYNVTVGSDGVISMATARGGIEFGALPEPGGPTHFHIMRPAGQNSSTDLFFGDDFNYVKLPALYSSNPDSQQGVEIGSSLNEGTVSIWKFGTDGNITLPSNTSKINYANGTSILDGLSSGGATLLPPYKGFRAHYGRMYNNTGDENGPINKIVIYKDTVSPSSAIDTSTNSDDFQVTELTGSDVVAMLVVISDGTDWETPTPTATLKTFAEDIIDYVILNGGVPGDVRSISQMKDAFYNSFNDFKNTIGNVKTNLEFFDTPNNPQYNITNVTYNGSTGAGANFSSIQYNFSNSSFELGSWGQNQPGGYTAGDTFTILGTDITDANTGAPFASPENDTTITVVSVDGSGFINETSVTTGIPVPSTPDPIWPDHSINDGGDDEYDGGNAIHTNLATNIPYNSGNVVSSSSAFNGGDYVVTYKDGIFGVFATNADIDIIGTSGDSGGYGNDSGSSGFDGDGQADTGGLYGEVVAPPSKIANGTSYANIDTADGNLVIGINNTSTWSFGADGALTLPAGGDIKNSAGTSQFISVSALKTLVADSTDFADFKTRIAAL